MAVLCSLLVGRKSKVQLLSGDCGAEYIVE